MMACGLAPSDPLRRAAVLAILILVVALLGRPGATTAPALAAEPIPGTGDDFCAVPEDLLADDERLPGLAARMRARLPVTIVAVGGASTRGVGALDAAYPARLAVELRRRYPDTTWEVLNRGAPHQTAAQMVARFERDVLSANPDLVIWETGTNDAVRLVPPDEFAAVLTRGLALLHAHGIETVLVDMQYARESVSVINFEPYLDAIRNVAQVSVARLFRRYEIMKFWADGEIFPTDDHEEDRQRLPCLVYECIARRLADMITLATR